jgi:hypothetical protein
MDKINYRREQNNIDSSQSRTLMGLQSQDSTLQIRTIPDGYNSGRVYYLRANTTACCRKIMTDLTKAVNVARKRAEVKTRFEKAQHTARKLHDSLAFQALSAIFITLVCSKFQYARE